MPERPDTPASATLPGTTTARPGGTVRGQQTADLLGAVVLGLLVGLLGTAVHLHLIPLDGGWALPWGALLALTMAGTTQGWWTLRTGNVRAGGVVGIAAFTTAMAVMYLPRHDRLGIPVGSPVLAEMPGVNLAGGLWTIGLPLVSVAVLILTSRGARRRDR